MYDSLKSDYAYFRKFGKKSEAFDRSILHSISYLINFLSVHYDDIRYGSIINSVSHGKIYQMYVMSFYVFRCSFDKLHPGEGMCSLCDVIEVFQGFLHESSNSSMKLIKSMTSCLDFCHSGKCRSNVLIIEIAEKEGTAIMCYAKETFTTKSGTYKLVGICTNEDKMGVVVNSFTKGIKNGS